MDNKNIDTNKELTLDEVSKISSSLGKFNTLLISGGEPFLKKELTEICRIFYLQNKVHNIYLPTNGFNTEVIYKDVHKILNQCPNISLIIGISLDGLQQAHDKIKGVEGSFGKAVETIKKLSLLKHKFHTLDLGVITVVNKANLNRIIELSEFVKNNLPVDWHGPSPLRGIPYDKALLPPSYKEWDDLSKKLIKYRKFWDTKNNNKFRTFFATNRIRYLYAVYTYVLKNNKLPFKCQAGNSICVLEPNGDVRLCELTQAIGNVRNTNYDLKKALSSERAIEIKKEIKDKGCACTHACFLNPSIRSNLPALFKSYFYGRL